MIAVNPLKDKIESSAELALSLDVIYHLVEDDVFLVYIHKLAQIAEKFIIIYAPDYDSDAFAKHVRLRKFTDHPALSDFELIHHEPNKFPSTDHTQGSFSEFYVFQRKS